MAGPPDLHALALELLAADIAALDTIPISAPGLEGSPERAFVSAGRPAFDCCPQLSVHVDTIQDAETRPGGLAGGRRNVTGKVNHVRLITTIVRCVPSTGNGQSMVDAPLVVDLEAVAEQTNADAWALWNEIYNMWRSDQLFSVCGEVFFEGMRSLAEEGRCVGWTMTLRVSLGGYNDIEAS